MQCCEFPAQLLSNKLCLLLLCLERVCSPAVKKQLLNWESDSQSCDLSQFSVFPYSNTLSLAAQLTWLYTTSEAPFLRRAYRIPPMTRPRKATEPITIPAIAPLLIAPHTPLVHYMSYPAH